MKKTKKYKNKKVINIYKKEVGKKFHLNKIKIVLKMMTI